MTEIILCLLFEPERDARNRQTCRRHSLFLVRLDFGVIVECKVEGYRTDIEDLEASPFALLLLKVEKTKHDVEERKLCSNINSAGSDI